MAEIQATILSAGKVKALGVTGPTFDPAKISMAKTYDILLEGHTVKMIVGGGDNIILTRELMESVAEEVINIYYILDGMMGTPVEMIFNHNLENVNLIFNETLEDVNADNVVTQGEHDTVEEVFKEYVIKYCIRSQRFS